jgi:hypothetical protein
MTGKKTKEIRMDSAMSAKDICAIVRACRGSGVSKLSLKDLSIEFGGEVSATQQIHYSKDVIEETEKPSQEEFNFQLALDNPVEWERLEMGGGLDGAI